MIDEIMNSENLLEGVVSHNRARIATTLADGEQWVSPAEVSQAIKDFEDYVLEEFDNPPSGNPEFAIRLMAQERLVDRVKQGDNDV